ncbi:hypothetical protein CANCADRAFT_90532 [Tortispora caseinolytica NRRL Y-17796]|uniref:Zn(2)-C6 fungal-type domain-containing protein n=1 Tax=Tortispora caseinolytica NRRL Y-17796 TaxID=767744 RepID=A0A1E4TLN7_9ASCO|nr:hypothetical protein CANCADRAFT_90532 [Tortispora caseinolytica NRRL Y-17796]
MPSLTGIASYSSSSSILHHTMTELVSKAPKVASRACLTCRKRHVRCIPLQGSPKCEFCAHNNKDCEFIQSRRGGRRPRQSAGSIDTSQGSRGSQSSVPDLDVDTGSRSGPSSDIDSDTVIRSISPKLHSSLQQLVHVRTDGQSIDVSHDALLEHSETIRDLFVWYYTHFFPSHPIFLSMDHVLANILQYGDLVAALVASKTLLPALPFISSPVDVKIPFSLDGKDLVTVQSLYLYMIEAMLQAQIVIVSVTRDLLGQIIKNTPGLWNSPRLATVPKDVLQESYTNTILEVLYCDSMFTMFYNEVSVFPEAIFQGLAGMVASSSISIRQNAVSFVRKVVGKRMATWNSRKELMKLDVEYCDWKDKLDFSRPGSYELVDVLGNVDQTVLQAAIAIYSCCIYLHFPLSSLKTIPGSEMSCDGAEIYNDVESNIATTPDMILSTRRCVNAAVSICSLLTHITVADYSPILVCCSSSAMLTLARYYSAITSSSQVPEEEVRFVELEIGVLSKALEDTRNEWPISGKVLDTLLSILHNEYPTLYWKLFPAMTEVPELTDDALNMVMNFLGVNGAEQEAAGVIDITGEIND